MEKLTNWLKLWEELSEIQSKSFSRKKVHQDDDFWKDKAKHFQEMVKRRWSKPDSSRDFIVEALKENPDSTLLDIGAGTGAWSLYLAPYAKGITALEPSEAMAGILKDQLEETGTGNISIVKENWPGIDIKKHDYILASHSMYGEADFTAFINKMNETARKTCFLVIRVLFKDAVMAKASEKIMGQPFDSPNFQVAYNALLDMGIYPSVLMEKGESWEPWTNDSMDDALEDIKNRLDLTDTAAHDDYLLTLLKSELTEKDGKVVWPSGNSSALVYWDV